MAVQQAKLFLRQKEFPDTANILDNLYISKLSELVDECCTVSEWNIFE